MSSPLSRSRTEPTCWAAPEVEDQPDAALDAAEPRVALVGDRGPAGVRLAVDRVRDLVAVLLAGVALRVEVAGGRRPSRPARSASRGRAALALGGALDVAGVGSAPTRPRLRTWAETTPATTSTRTSATRPIQRRGWCGRCVAPGPGGGRRRARLTRGGAATASGTEAGSAHGRHGGGSPRRLLLVAGAGRAAGAQRPDGRHLLGRLVQQRADRRGTRVGVRRRRGAAGAVVHDGDGLVQAALQVGGGVRGAEHLGEGLHEGVRGRDRRARGGAAGRRGPGRRRCRARGRRRRGPGAGSSSGVRAAGRRAGCRPGRPASGRRARRRGAGRGRRRRRARRCRRRGRSSRGWAGGPRRSADRRS